ncbi:MAG TPA: hypothetical protein VFV03_09040 [Solirubrobacteraceae bacterium]|nr:hypothetical protein [Solirubrobacteraceae bacterium]
MLRHLRPRTLLPTLLACGVLLAISAGALAGPRGHAASASSTRDAHSAASYLTGIGDQQTEMFANPLWQQLHTKIARYIAPYDAAVRPYSLKLARQWITTAEAQHQQVLVAFYHSEYTPTKTPSLAVYQRDVRKFVALFPKVRQYQPWNETNRGNVPHLFSSPSAMESAKDYKALKSICRGCTVLGLDILDGPSVGPSLRYVAEFKRALAHLKTAMPSVWGLHNYSDTNRFSSVRTRAILAAVPGQVWLTETGGIVKFGGAFPNRKGSGLARAAKALSYMFRLASSNSRIKRLYIFQWSGSTGAVRFDAGLTDPRYNPRPGYVTVCKQLHAAKCRMKTSNR